MKQWIIAVRGAVQRGAQRVANWGKTSEPQPARKPRPKNTTTASKKKVKKRVVKNSFANVRADVMKLSTHAVALEERLRAVEAHQGESTKETATLNRSVQKHTDQLTSITAELSTHSYRIEEIEKLPDRLKKEFADLIAEAKAVQMPKVLPPPSLVMEDLPLPDPPVSYAPKTSGGIVQNFTPYTRRAFFLIISMLQESGTEWLPLSDLIADLYPDRTKPHNIVSNLLKPLYTASLIEKQRRASRVWIRPTDLGLAAVKETATKDHTKKVEEKIRTLRKR